MKPQKTRAYLRVSTDEQDLRKNRSDILHLANEKNLGKVIWVEETILAPGVYRILQPAIEGFLAPQAEPLTLLWLDMILQTACVMVSIPLLYAWLRRWASEGNALIGVCIFCVVNLMAYHFFLRAISTSFEVVFVLGALALLREKRYN